MGRNKVKLCGDSQWVSLSPHIFCRLFLSVSFGFVKLLQRLTHGMSTQKRGWGCDGEGANESVFVSFFVYFEWKNILKSMRSSAYTHTMRLSIRQFGSVANRSCVVITCFFVPKRRRRCDVAGTQKTRMRWTTEYGADER